MALTNPRADYALIWQDIVDLLTDNKNVTYLNKGLTKVVQQIIIGDPFIYPVPMTLYPTIMVNFIGKIEQHTAIGGKRPEVDPTFRVFGITDKLTTQAASLIEAVKLLDNIEAVFRDNIALKTPGLVLTALPKDGDVGIARFDDGAFIHVSFVDILCNKRLI